MELAIALALLLYITVRMPVWLISYSYFFKALCTCLWNFSHVDLKIKNSLLLQPASF
jgi:hypothetical protein